jgi:hypothetical protein
MSEKIYFDFCKKYNKILNKNDYIKYKLLSSYDVKTRKIIIRTYEKYTKKIMKKMFSNDTVDSEGYTIYSGSGIGGDDGHSDFARYIALQGNKVIDQFFEDPYKLYPLAKKFVKMGIEMTLIDYYDNNGNLSEDYIETLLSRLYKKN